MTTNAFTADVTTTTMSDRDDDDENEEEEEEPKKQTVLQPIINIIITIINNTVVTHPVTPISRWREIIFIPLLVNVLFLIFLPVLLPSFP